MTVNKRTKFSRQRGSHTHGWGSKKKHRGAGNRGGRGMSGSGKRGDAMKTLYWKDPHYFGKYGFKTKGVKKEIRAVNLDYIEEHLGEFLEEGTLKKGMDSMKEEKKGNGGGKEERKEGGKGGGRKIGGEKGEEGREKEVIGGVIDLAEFGYNKLLGRGAVKTKLNIKVDSASNKAVEKVKKAGGSVLLKNVCLESHT